MNAEQSTVCAVRKNSNDAAFVARRKIGNWFRLTDSCDLVLHRGDITKWHVDGETDAIVNAANTRMLGGAGVDGAIHDSAGPELREACKLIPQVARGVRCPTGEARVTKGFQLSVSRVIHTVGPIYPGNNEAKQQLTTAYKNSVLLAVQEGVKYIAFPAISCGIYGYPVDKAAVVALESVIEVSEGLAEVHFVLFEEKPYSSWLDEAQRKFSNLPQG